MRGRQARKSAPPRVVAIVTRTSGKDRRVSYHGGMRAVIVQVSADDLARRRRIGLDRWDEMWEGVLHMPPAPNYEHQRVLDSLVIFLGPLLQDTGRGTLRSGINVFHEARNMENYRIPDLTFVARGHEQVIAEDGIRGGPPDAVVEIRSPDDETYEKFPFFAALGVIEVIVIDRDSKIPEVFRLAGSRYLAVQPDADGWLTSVTLGVRLASAAGGTLVVEDRSDASLLSDEGSGLHGDRRYGAPAPDSKSSTRLPEGSSSSLCRPPLP
jgi:Uma2 family endonuclease